MKKFTTEHPVISFFLGIITITTLSIVIFWPITGIYTACQIGSAISGGYLIGGVCVLINKAIAKGYEKKTGESLQKLVDRTEKENQHARKTKSKEEDDDFDDGL